MRPLRLASAALLLLSVAGLAPACSSPSSDAGGSCSSYVSALNDYQRRCSAARGYTDARLSEYVARQNASCNAAIALPGSGANSGFLARCTNAIRTVACDAADVPECDVLPGTLSDGASCVSSDQCQSESCLKTSGTGCGACEARVAIGGACGATKRCIKGATCASPGSICVALVKNPVGGSCDSSKGESCDPTGYCDTATRICKARAQAGESCGSVPCARGLSCDFTTRTCGTPKTVGVGESCGNLSVCGDGLTCLSGKCATIAWVKPGGSCSAPGSRCEHGSCSSTTKLCPALIPDGGDCVSGSPTAVCDDFASCLDGKCTLPAKAVCK